MKNKMKVKTVNFIVMAAAFFLLGACGSEPQQVPVISPVELRPVAVLNNITLSGIVESVERRNVYTTLGFRIDRIYAEVGDRVHAGQVLAVLDTADLELAIAQQQANITIHKASVAQQRSSLEVARRSARNEVEESLRILRNEQANLANNTNVHILSAEAALSAAELYLEAMQQSYDDARRDYNLRNNPQVLSAESMLRTARVELDRIELDYANFSNLFTGGIITQDELRQSENALTHARNRYNDARTGYENAIQSQQRSLELLRISLETAATSRYNAVELLNAARISAYQSIEMFRGNVTRAELSANIVDNIVDNTESMEIALKQLERQLEESTITAPISGTVTAVIATEGATGTGLLFTVEDTDNLRIITSFREYDLGKVEQGMQVTITSNATGSAEYAGIITRINPAATPSSPVVEFEAEVAVTSATTNLRIGMNTRLSIALE